MKRFKFILIYCTCLEKVARKSHALAMLVLHCVFFFIGCAPPCAHRIACGKYDTVVSIVWVCIDKFYKGPDVFGLLTCPGIPVSQLLVSDAV